MVYVDRADATSATLAKIFHLCVVIYIWSYLSELLNCGIVVAYEYILMNENDHLPLKLSHIYTYTHIRVYTLNTPYNNFTTFEHPF